MTTYLADGYQQSDDPNRNWKKVGLFIALIIILCVLFSCNPEKRIARQDNNSLQRVLAKNDLLTAVGWQFIKDHPIRCDSAKPIYIQGKPIEIPVIITVQDSAAIKAAIDSTQKSIHQPNCDYAIDASYKEGYNAALKSHPPTLQVDTFKIKVQLQSQIDMLTDSVNKKNIQIATMNGQLIESHSAYDTIKKKLTQIYWAIGIVIFVLIGITAFKVYTSFKPKI